MSKRDKYASLLDQQDDNPDQQAALSSLLGNRKSVKQELQDSGILLNKKDRVNSRGRIKVTFELDKEMERRLKQTALNHEVKVVDLVHAIFDKMLEQ